MSVKITEEQINRAKRVNLPDFLIANGFDLKRIGNEYVWKEHDSLHIKNNEPGEEGKWFRFSTNKGGDNIDFLKEFMNYSFVEAVEALTGEKAMTLSFTNKQPPPDIPLKTNNKKEFTIKENNDCKRAIAYLTQTRKIDYNFVIKLVKSGAISQEEKTGNVLFKFFDKDKIIGAEKVGTSTEHRYKGIATGSAKNLGFELKRGNGEKAYFFESAIDMLSFIQLHNKELDNCRLISMMGVKPNTVIETMKRNNINPVNVYLCSDNDEAGNEFAERLQAEYPEMKRLVTPDIYKDWNDMLRDIRKPEPVKEEKKSLVAVTEEITQKNKHFTELVNSGEFSQANEISQQLSELNDKADLLKKDIQEENITINDIEVLRSIEPKRKSIQNMLEAEVAKTPKFEKLLNEELGEKSAYEMRKGNNAWREDENKTVPVIDVQKLDTSHVREDKKNGVLKRGNFINKDTGIIINFGNAGIEDTLSHAAFKAKRHISTDVNISSLYHMQELIENAICFDTNISEAIKNKSSNSLFMHKMYGVIKYEDELYLAVLSIEESYATEKEKNNELSSTNNRMYNLKGIKITPTKLKTGFSVPSILSNDSRAELRGVTISIPQLYNFVKTFDKNFYENRNALGRAEREKEIAEHNEYLSAVKKLEEHNNKKSLNKKGMSNMPVQEMSKTKDEKKEEVKVAEPETVAIPEKNKVQETDLNKQPEQTVVNQQHELTEEEILKMAEQIKAKHIAEKTQEKDEQSEIPQDKSTQFHNPISHGKLLPFLNAKADNYTSRLSNLSEKRNTRMQKLEKNIKKIEKLTTKAEKLEDMNKLLSGLNIPVINTLIERNQNKIKQIREEKIPNRKEKVQKHKNRIAEIDKKSQILGHKLERCVALSDTIKSFAFVGKERRQIFSKALDDLNKSTYNCLCDKRENLLSQKEKEIAKAKELPENSKKIEIHSINEKYSGKMQRIEDKISKINLSPNFHEENIDENIDKIITSTKQTIDNNIIKDNISIAGVCENICEQNAVEMNKVISEPTHTKIGTKYNYEYYKKIPQGDRLKRSYPEEQAAQMMNYMNNNNIKFSAVTQNDGEITITVNQKDEILLNSAEKNYLKYAEMSIEDNYNSIDGIINNVKNNAETVGEDNLLAYKEIERDSGDQSWTDREKLLKSNDKFILKSFDGYNQKETEKELSLTEALDLLNGKEMIMTAEGSTLIQNEFGKTEPNKSSSVEKVMPKEIAENTCAELDSKNIQYTRTEDDKEAVNVQVSEENEQDLKQAEKNAVEKQATVYINKVFFKSLDKDERYTQRMDEKSAREIINDLASKGIEHSAVLNGDKSGVTIRKDDYNKSRASFSMKQLKKIGEKINHNYKSQEATQKEKSTIEH